MVFQDGGGYVGTNNPMHTLTVLDNLIAQHKIPPLVGLFVEPGVKANGDKNRSFEYDRLSDSYARFILEDLLPEAPTTRTGE